MTSRDPLSSLAAAGAPLAVVVAAERAIAAGMSYSRLRRPGGALDRTHVLFCVGGDLPGEVAEALHIAGWRAGWVQGRPCWGWSSPRPPR